VLCACIFGAGCAKKKHKVPVVASPRINSTETGIASWYGPPYHGRRAANGEIYDMEKLTAAHRTLPFNTWVEVSNLDNGSTVTVRITDRGPFIDGRIIDLSKAAAREIKMLGPGIANVRLRIVEAPPGEAIVAAYAVQAGAFQDRDRAEALRVRLEEAFGSARLVQRADSPTLWRVIVGNVPTQEEADQLRLRIRASGQAAFVVRLDDPLPTQPAASK
jgi:rare lipoprotein A